MNEYYAAQVRQLNNTQWDLIDGIKADRLDFGGSQSPIRSLLLHDDTVIEYPANEFVFKFSPMRHAILNKNNIQPEEER